LNNILTQKQDSPDFTIKGAEQISAKKTSPVAITYKGSSNAGKKVASASKLAITHTQSGTQWIYYLKGLN
jgi:hypothetical protein